MQTATPQPKFFRPKEAAEVGRVGLSTLWSYIKQGKLKTHKPSPRVTLLNAQDVYEFFGLIKKGA